MTQPAVEFVLNGDPVSVAGGGTLLDALRESLGIRSVKDGCSPQGQCGCCTVWVDEQPRVSCVTPVARVAGRRIATVEGLVDAADWADSFCDHGGSQCGFCTPGIIIRAAALDADQRASTTAIRQAMLAHLCRCTGWQPILDSVVAVHEPGRRRGDARAGATRATLEGGVAQSTGPQVALGNGGFADDLAPAGALVAFRDGDGEWVVGETLGEARAASGKVQGRRTTAPLTWPLELPDGDWHRTLRTTWIEPAYLEPDASWCLPGGEPASSHGNGGAFGGKTSGTLGAVARRLADEHGRPVRVIATREDVARLGPKRPPMAAGVRGDGSGVVRVVRTPGIAAAIGSIAPQLDIVEVDVVGPPTSSALRAAGWAEAAVLMASLSDARRCSVTAPNGARAWAEVDADGAVAVGVRCGASLDPVVLRSYCMGATHMALGWVRSEGLAIHPDGTPADLTIRSFGVLRAVDTPTITVEIEDDDGEPINGSDAVFAAVAAAAWAAAEWPPAWPALP